MPTYIFASLRGNDFEIEGDTPQDAFENLLKREEDEGTTWRLYDNYCNNYAVIHRGFMRLDKTDAYSPVYKVKQRGN